MLSDVPGDKIDVIASGPFTFNTAGYEEAWGILEEARAKLIARNVLEPDQSPETVFNYLRQGAKGQHPLPLSKALPNVTNKIVGSNTLAVNRVVEELRNAGYMVHGDGIIYDVDLKQFLDDRGDTAGAFKQAVELLNRMRSMNGNGPFAIVMGGEPNVDLANYQGGQGHGGRMQMFAAQMAAVLADQPEVGIFVATDGSDHVPPPGLPVVAGAVVDGHTQLIAKARGLMGHIAAANPYEFHRAIGTHLVLPEVTNVLDVIAIAHGMPAGVAEALRAVSHEG
jgi:glycerate-2-kinase